MKLKLHRPLRLGAQLERGQSFVEMAFGMIILLLLLGGLADIGRAFLILVAVENAAGEGALYGASHPECLTTDHSASICVHALNQSVKGRVKEEGRPVINLSDGDINVVVEGGVITAGTVLRIDVTYKYSPVTPVGFMLWGSTASVTASARQQIMSPPPPGYNT